MSLSEVEWRSSVPDLVDRCVEEWELRLGAPYPGGTASYVAPVRTADGRDAVLKLSLPHREARGEAAALRWWAGDGAVQMFRHDPDRWALLIERCDPGDPISEADLPAHTRLTIAAELLAGLWRKGVPSNCELEHVADVTAEWATGVEERMHRLAPPYDPGIVARGVELLRTLPATAERTVVVHGDFNPGNILSSARQPWLVIDADPMIGDPAYDLPPLLLQIDEPLAYDDPLPVLRTRVALLSDILDEPAERLYAWSVARMVEAALWYADRGELEEGSAELSRAAVIARLLD